MPFGMKNSPATFQGMINDVITGLEGYEAYIDDVFYSEKPTIVCPDNIDTTTEPGKPTSIVHWASPSANDNSGDVTVTSNYQSGMEFYIGLTIISFHATDPSGNMDSCHFNITVIDSETPTIVCPDNIDTTTEPGKPTSIVHWASPSANDNSGDVTVTSNYQSGMEFYIGLTIISFHATDPSGNMDSCHFNITVIDSETPTIVCPDNIDTTTDPGKPSAIVHWVSPSANDNSGNVTVTSNYQSGMEFYIGLTIISFHATDPSGNMDSCHFNITVIDSEKPTILCPNNISTTTEPGKPTAILHWAPPSANDNSGNVIVTSNYQSGMEFYIGLTIVSFHATDPSRNIGSCHFNITVIDNEDPNITCPEDFIQETDLAKPFAVVYWPEPNATDNSGSVNVTCSHQQGSKFTIGSTKVICNASDPFSNWNTCHFKVKVIDNEDPNLTCPEDFIQETDLAKPFAVVFWSEPNATDNSGSVNVTCSHQQGSKFTIGSTKVICNASDPFSNWNACHFKVKVVDKEQPTITCPGDIEHATLVGEPFAIANWLYPNATDNSGNVTVTCSHESGTEFKIGSSKVSFNASDPYGNWYSCHFQVIVIDREEPTIFCPGNIDTNTDFGKPTAIVNWTSPYATDNSGTVTVTSYYQSGMDFNIGLTVVSLNATDPSGNMDLCHFNITVIDNEDPHLTCPEDFIQETDIAKPFAVVYWPEPNVTDNSGSVNVTCTHHQGSKFTIGSTNIFCNATDPFSNWNTCHFKVTVKDKEPPNMTCLDEIKNETLVGKPFAIVTWPLPNATDNSGNVTVTCSHESGTEFQIGSRKVFFNASDPFGNWYSCHSQVVVIDVECPIITCPDKINMTTNPGKPTAVVNWTQPNATDNSGIVNVSSNHQSGSKFVINITVVNYTAKDPSGNEASCHFNVSVFDLWKAESESGSTGPVETTFLSGGTCNGRPMVVSRLVEPRRRWGWWRDSLADSLMA
ncbi:hyalin-like [Ptychodera flava]|uniref:hyalin-like n=1 Tax=Ptychodera flava TaxID=63121 RepID=UPI003969ED0D